MPTEKIMKFDPLYQVWAIPVGGMIITNDDSVGKCLKRGEVTHHHLYVISDEEIEEGDWFIRAFSSIKAVEKYIKDDFLYSGDRKIVATTDTSLWEHDDTVPYPKTRPALPRIPRSFIKQYIESGGSIDEIDMFNQNIETDSGEYIILKPTKKYWTREEVEDMLFDISTELSWDDKDEEEKILNCQDKIKEIRENL